ncbi:MAG: 8-oxoguanine DNA glycosylase [Clostridiales bacterium]|nr:8-oxoguanine DNA glycosylase [Clostridiales bacterium]
MKYEITIEGIKVYDKSQFNIAHIFECGQVFCFENVGEKYISYPQNHYAEIEENKDFYLIKTKNVDYFVNYFDLDVNYTQIKEKLSDFSIMKKPLEYGYGIRILNQDLFETLISFIISANNNIKRIKVILNNIRKSLGEKLSDNVYSFPSYEKLKDQKEEFFVKCGAGYRAKYLVKVLQQISPAILKEWDKLDTISLRNKLISLAGVGPKVADCILLFAYHRGESFPVDTWIAQMYNQHFSKTENREFMRNDLVNKFGALSGYAQQYIFYYTRFLAGKN